MDSLPPKTNQFSDTQAPAASPLLVKDIFPGLGSSYPGSLTALYSVSCSQEVHCRWWKA